MATGQPRTVAVTSGKGGVGKSCVALNLAVVLARRQQRVLLVDADLGLGNISILLGLSPDYTVEDVLQETCRVEQAVVEGPEGIAVLPAASDVGVGFWESAAASGAGGGPLKDFEAGFDFIIVDTAAGIAAKVVDFVMATDEVLLLVTPEPTSIADAYAVLKVLLQKQPQLSLELLVNMADSAAEAGELHAKFQEIVRRFLGAEIDNRGYIPLDRYVREAVKRQMPFVLANPPTPAAEALAQIAGDLLRQKPVAPVRGGGVFERALERRAMSEFPDLTRYRDERTV